VFALTLLVLCVPLGRAPAATPTASFGVSAMVQDTCLVSASDVKFTTYAEAMVKAISVVSVKCTNSTPYNIGLSTGQGNDGAGVRRAYVATGAYADTVAVAVIY
jgi:spore coat protein U-like protein